MCWCITVGGFFSPTIADMLSSTASLIKPLVELSPSLTVPFGQLNRTMPPQDKPQSNAQSSAQVPSERLPVVTDVPSLQNLCVSAVTAKAQEKASHSGTNAAGVFGAGPTGKSAAWVKHALELIQLLEQAVVRRVQLSSEVQWLHNSSHSSSRDKPCLDAFSPSRQSSVEGTNNQLCKGGITATNKCNITAVHKLREGPSLTSSGEAVANIDKVVEGQAKVGILFSGGVDSAVLAAITDR